MATIVNRSHATVEVFGESGGVDAVFELEPGKQTGAGFDAKQIRTRRFSASTIFKSGGWWLINTTHAFIYTFEPGVIWDELSLHCVPFRSGSGNPPWDEGFKLAPANATRDALSLSDPQVQDPAFPLGPFDGELSYIPDGDFQFGIQVRTTMGNNTYVTVRLLARPSIDLLGGIRDRITTATTKWKDLIERTWRLAKPSSTGQRLHCEVVWDLPCHHNEVNIVPQLVATALGPFETTYLCWSIDLDKDVTSPQEFPVCAHEFGHHLGLNDGYVIDLELPYLAENDSIKALLKEFEPRKLSTAVLSFYSLIGAFYPLGKARAEKRLAAGECATDRDIMDDGNKEDGGTEPVIDSELVDSILLRKPQSLCFSKNQLEYYVE